MYTLQIEIFKAFFRCFISTDNVILPLTCEKVKFTAELCVSDPREAVKYNGFVR